MGSEGGGDEAAVLAAAEDMANGAGDEAGLDDMVEHKIWSRISSSKQ